MLLFQDAAFSFVFKFCFSLDKEPQDLLIGTL